MIRATRRRAGAAIAALALASWAVLAGPAAARQDDADEPPEIVYLEADEIFTDEESGRYVARGAVEIRYGTRTLTAEEVTVYPDEGRVRATGGVTIIDDAGVVTRADEAELSDDLREGIIEGFSARLPNEGKTGAAFAIRRGGSVNEMRRAFYTVCEACEADGRRERPTWRLRARRVTQDTNAQMLYYRDAVLEIKGVPVLYAPFFAHADPSSERRSGFLLPYFGESSRTGSYYEQPYYWAISDSQDMTVSPRFMTDASPLVVFEHRKKFFSGGTVFEGSITNEQEFDDTGSKFGERLWRGHIFGDGEFALTDTWRWGFSIERVSDDLYFKRYEIDDADAARGLYRRGSKRLLSQLFLEGAGDDYYASLAAFAFQGLRAGDDEDLFPVVGPYGEYRRRLGRNVLGGRLYGRVNTASLHRTDGTDSSRVSAELDWRRRLITPGGVVAEPFAFARGDVYRINDYTTPGGATLSNEVVTRGLGYVGVQASWPFGRSAGRFNLVLEPVVSIVASPLGGNDERIPNEDSLVVDLDEANIFSPNRAPGFDIWEDGVRAAIGGRAVARWNGSGEASFFLGQSFRSSDAVPFGATSGLDEERSDIIGAAEIALDRRRRVAARFRLDDASYDLQRLDLDASYVVGPASLSGKYLRLSDDFAATRPREELSFTAGVEVTRNWGAYYRSTLDLEADETRFAFFGIVYDDECSRLELIYKRDGTVDRVIGSGDSVRLQFTLTSIGTFGSH